MYKSFINKRSMPKKEDFSDKELNELKGAFEEVREMNESGKLNRNNYNYFITISNLNKKGIANRINMYIKTRDYSITIKDIYCEVSYGMNRFFEVIYHLFQIAQGEHKDGYNFIEGYLVL